MPRTKYTRSSKVRSKFSISNVKKEKPEFIDICIANFERDANTAVLNFKNRTDSWVEALEHTANDEYVIVNPILTKKTLRQLRTEKSFSASSMKSTMFETASMLKHLNFTYNTTVTAPANKKKHTDEGYLTAGDSASSGDSEKRKRQRSSSTSRQSRQTERSKPKTRVSRSLSRVKAPKKNVTINAAEKKTPNNAMRPPMTFGTVTPKMKPNMPLSILRRPNHGEMAISMQGSPLLVSGVISERYANVNIPLTDGRILSLQPSRALRMSEIPHLDEHTRKQLAQLRDNLSKVVKIAYDDDD